MPVKKQKIEISTGLYKRLKKHIEQDREILNLIHAENGTLKKSTSKDRLFLLDLEQIIKTGIHFNSEQERVKQEWGLILNEMLKEADIDKLFIKVIEKGIMAIDNTHYIKKDLISTGSYDMVNLFAKSLIDILKKDISEKQK